MRANELRELPEGELTTHIETQRRELFGLRFQHATGSLEDTSALRNAKRELARALTVANQRRATTNTES
ncbi:MAG: 50S ribosomal protein L29 [Solirubrobacteraceae bacterium]|nr:50S ribosomal protein L29 [Solirubrobacteraceae bacterium]